MMTQDGGCGCCTHLNGTLPLWVFLPEQEQRQDADEEAERLDERDAVNEEEDVSDAEQQDRHQTLKHTNTCQVGGNTVRFCDKTTRNGKYLHSKNVFVVL